MIYLAIAILSVFLGSFYNVCIHRILREESVIYPPSHCPDCGHSLGPLDLVPVFSYVFLMGRCRYCKARISPRYPLVEVLTSITYLLLYKVFGLSWSLVAYSFFLGVLIIITFIDIEYQIIPNSLILLGLIFGILFGAINITTGIVDALLGLVIGFGSLLVIAILAKVFIGKEGMGGGDIKLLGVIGLFLGWKLTLLTLILSIYIGGVFSILLLLLKIKKRGEYIPFGPFISLAGLIALLWGNSIIQWYVGISFPI
ncbi:MAG TPA: prepilin peptidase [Clostridia bacterium]|nr:prepilin peptidase [Clostridia bacterium]